MLRLSFLTFIRATLRNSKISSFINIFGLTVALSFFFLIFIYIQNERSYDNFHEKGHRVVRVLSNFTETDRNLAVTPYAWMPALLEKVPEVEYTTSFLRYTPSFRKGDIMINEPKGLGVEPSFFEIFDFPVISGDKTKFLNTIDGIVLTDKMAIKYFGDLDVLGKTMSSFDDEGNPVDYVIEGVVKCPRNSHIQFDYMLSFEYSKISYRLRSQRLGLPNRYYSWDTHFCSNYLLLKENSDPEAVVKKLTQLIKENLDVDQSSKFTPFLQSLEDIYLKSDYSNDFPPRGDFKLLVVLGVIAFALVVLALFNFVNLSIANSLKRVKEIGLKKTFGSTHSHLFSQFIVEAFLLILISAFLASIVIIILLPGIDHYLGKPIQINSLLTPGNVLFILFFIIAISSIAGVYPALKFSKLKPSQVLYSSSSYSLESGRLRSGLIVFQLCVSVIMIICTSVIFKQIKHMAGIDPGFVKEHKLLITHWGVGESDFELNRLRNALSPIPQVKTVSASNNAPGLGRSYYRSFNLPGSDANEPTSISTFYSDMQIIDALDLEIIEGRDFDETITSDSTRAYIINESALDLFRQYSKAWKDNVVGQNLERVLSDGTRRGKVIGVVKDFQFDSFKKEIEPLVICIESLGRSRVLIKLESNLRQQEKVLSSIQSIWRELHPNSSFNYRFLDDQFEQYLKNDKINAKLILMFSLLTMAISSLGIFGLISFVSKSRMKEFSVRKVTGASHLSLLLLMNKKFIKLAFIGCLLAYPASYLAMNKWLSQFAHRIPMPLESYLFATLACLLVTSLIISGVSVADIKKSPTEVLRSE